MGTALFCIPFPQWLHSQIWLSVSLFPGKRVRVVWKVTSVTFQEFQNVFLSIQSPVFSDTSLRSANWRDANAFPSHYFHHHWSQRPSEEQHFLKCSQLSLSVKHNWHNLSPFQTSLSAVKAIQYMSQTGGLIFSQVIPYKKLTVQTVIKLLHFKSLILQMPIAVGQAHCLRWQPCSQQVLVIACFWYRVFLR